MIVEYLKTFDRAQKKDITKLLWDKLPDVLDEKQKRHKVANLLKGLQKKSVIGRDSENRKTGYWVLIDE